MKITQIIKKFKYLILGLLEVGVIGIGMILYLRINGLKMDIFKFINRNFFMIFFYALIPLIGCYAKDKKRTIKLNKDIETHFLQSKCGYMGLLEGNFEEEKETIKGICNSFLFPDYSLTLAYEDEKGLSYISETTDMLGIKKKKKHKTSILTIYYQDDPLKIIITCAYEESFYALDNIQNEVIISALVNKLIEKRILRQNLIEEK